MPAASAPAYAVCLRLEAQAQVAEALARMRLLTNTLGDPPAVFVDEYEYFYHSRVSLITTT
jgi:hypothetical protein